MRVILVVQVSRVESLIVRRSLFAIPCPLECIQIIGTSRYGEDCLLLLLLRFAFL